MEEPKGKAEPPAPMLARGRDPRRGGARGKGAPGRHPAARGGVRVPEELLPLPRPAASSGCGIPGSASPPCPRGAKAGRRGTDLGVSLAAPPSSSRPPAFTVPLGWVASKGSQPAAPQLAVVVVVASRGRPGAGGSPGAAAPQPSRRQRALRSVLGVCRSLAASVRGIPFLAVRGKRRRGRRGLPACSPEPPAEPVPSPGSALRGEKSKSSEESDGSSGGEALCRLPRALPASARGQDRLRSARKRRIPPRKPSRL